MNEIDKLAAAVIEARGRVPASNALLAGISGIDASGKGFVTGQLAEHLDAAGVRCAVIHADDWLNLPKTRFCPSNPAQHFYANAIRFEVLFESLILPLRSARSIGLTALLATETGAEYYQHHYDVAMADVILLEGIFLFKQRHVNYFDLKIWIECAFDTALRRAIARSQEALSLDETIRAYNEIYFPAQRLHLSIDDPRGAADIVFSNP